MAAKPPQEPRVAEIVALVRPLIPEISPEQLAEIVHSVAPVPLTQRLLELALLKQPGVLEGRHRNVPVTVQDLAHALVAEGASRVVLPTCESCGRAVRMPHKTPNGGRHCSRCERNARSVACATCGRVRPVQRTIDGKRYCRECWRADRRSFGLCSRCGQHATIVVRRPELVCLNCYTAPIKTCGLCGEPGRVASHLDGRRVCARCYYAMRTPQPCPECGRKVFLTGFMNGQKVCADCAGSPITMACPSCGSIEEVRKHRLCAECRRPITIQRLLCDDTGSVRPELLPLADYLLTHHGKANSLERWQHKTSRPVKLTIGAEPIELPEVLGNAIAELADTSRHRPEGWLFPGRNPGLHLTPGPLSRRLRQQGLRSGSARTTALIELTRQMHPRIVSDLLGITAASAAAWSRLASGDWTDYPKLRAEP